MRSLILAITLGGCGADTARPEPRLPERAATLDVTHGALHGPEIRAVAPGSRGDRAALRFRYHGPTAERAQLASGATRGQVGLKLRAADSCNVVYVMWRVAERPSITVQVKRNPGVSRHAECGTSGYERVRAVEQRLPGPPDRKREHVLVAAIDGDELAVWADHALVWRGTLPASARELRGPAGFRADNVDVEVALHAD